CFASGSPRSSAVRARNAKHTPRTHGFSAPRSRASASSWAAADASRSPRAHSTTASAFSANASPNVPPVVRARATPSSAAVLAGDDDHGTADHRREQRERIVETDTGDSYGRIEVEAGREHAQPCEESTLVVVQEVETPVDGSTQRLLPCHGFSPSLDEELETVLQAGVDCSRREHVGARRGELDRQWEAVE